MTAGGRCRDRYRHWELMNNSTDAASAMVLSLAVVNPMSADQPPKGCVRKTQAAVQAKSIRTRRSRAVMGPGFGRVKDALAVTFRVSHS